MSQPQRVASCAIPLAMIIFALPPTPVPEAPPKATWTIRGKVRIAHQMDRLEMLAPKGSPLENIQVQVSAKEFKWWAWNEWRTVYTKSDGEFSFTIDKDTTPRWFRVRIRFQNDDLEIRQEHSNRLGAKKVKWYTAYEKDERHEAGRVSFDTFTLREGGHGDMGAWEPRRHADIWTLAQKAMNALGDFGSKYGFTNKLKIKYPAGDAFAKASYANPLNNVAYIMRDDFNDATILHEMMHIWAYQHSRNEDAIAAALIYNQFMYGTDTHGFQDFPYVSFHEGFAEYATAELQEILFGDSDRARLPFNRANLNSGVDGTADVLDTLRTMQRHDLGWLSIFFTLSNGSLSVQDFMEPRTITSDRHVVNRGKGILANRNVDEPDLTFKNILRVFNPSSDDGYLFSINILEMEFDSFMNRARNILNRLTRRKADALIRIIDPSETVQPFDLFTTPR